MEPIFEIGNYVETVQQGPFDHFHRTECGFIVARALTFVSTKRGFVETWLYKTTSDEKIFFPEHRLCHYTCKEIEEKLAKSLEEYEKLSQPKMSLWMEKFKGKDRPPCEFDNYIKYMEEQQQKQIKLTTFYIDKYKDIIEKYNSFNK